MRCSVTLMEVLIVVDDIEFMLHRLSGGEVHREKYTSVREGVGRCERLFGLDRKQEQTRRFNLMRRGFMIVYETLAGLPLGCECDVRTVEGTMKKEIHRIEFGRVAGVCRSCLHTSKGRRPQAEERPRECKTMGLSKDLIIVVLNVINM